ncbi:N-acetyltransferase domain-containing protein [Fusarium keratoplasticum]|uniref:N-acetyltransferase domain-containing protein n=1 Tax=Fusarium keratoplasticum TaxID=1328300 RepID=A0ACC0RAC0_9HYPO|nr:N-acetyltransferase domain-containing protein [Fusarium keratoplasticum]KAI8680391.1 N-acetyltransferase domain-containing protein [Fusarium keratoplasticum]KAI8686456.1 N-acetyltransferase domain-containing protein [Fusarium keratoplasticum]
MFQPKMRLAEEKDVDQITQVFLTAMQDDQDLFRSFISPEYDDWSVVIVEVLDDAQAWRIVAFSAWDISYVNKRVHGPGYIPNSPQNDTRKAGHSRRDTDPKHLAAFQAALKESNQKYFSQFVSD